MVGITATAPIPVSFGRTGKKPGWKAKILIPLAALSIPLGSCGVMNINQALNGSIPADRFETGVESYTSPLTREGYKDNPQRSLGEATEKNLRKKYGERAFVGQEVDAARAEFNRTGNLDLFNRFFPYRSALTARGEMEKLRLHDERIREVVNSPHSEFWFVDLNSRVYPMDNSTRHILAGLIVDLMHNRMELVHETLEKQTPFRFILFEDLKRPNLLGGIRDIGGYWAPKSGDIEIDSRSFWIDSGISGNGEDTPVHEFVHAAESRHLILGIHLADGMLPGLSAEDRRAFTRERGRLLREFRALNDGIGYNILESQGKKMEAIPGIRPYAFKNRAEFLAVTHEVFFDGGEKLKEASPVLYDIYSRYYRLDTANGYRDLTDEDLRTAQQPVRFA